jgi:four helix bundle protein
MGDFRELTTWQKAMQLAEDVYSFTNSFPPAEVYNLTAQIRRSAVSIPSNIAEGQGRSHDGDFSKFLLNARGSAYELETQIELAFRLKYLDAAGSARLLRATEEVSKMLNGMLRSLGKDSGTRRRLTSSV